MRHRCCSMRRASSGPWSTTRSMPIRTRRTTPSSASNPRRSNSARRAGDGSPSSPSRRSLLLGRHDPDGGPRPLRLGWRWPRWRLISPGRSSPSISTIPPIASPSSAPIAGSAGSFSSASSWDGFWPAGSRGERSRRLHPGRNGAGRPAAGARDPALSRERDPAHLACDRGRSRAQRPAPALLGLRLARRPGADPPSPRSSRSRRRPAGAGFRRRQRANGHRRRHGRGRRRQRGGDRSLRPHRHRPQCRGQWRRGHADRGGHHRHDQAIGTSSSPATSATSAPWPSASPPGSPSSRVRESWC